MGKIQKNANGFLIISWSSIQSEPHELCFIVLSYCRSNRNIMCKMYHRNINLSQTIWRIGSEKFVQVVVKFRQHNVRNQFVADKKSSMLWSSSTSLVLLWCCINLYFRAISRIFPIHLLFVGCCGLTLTVGCCTKVIETE